MVARRAHNPEAVGSSPTPATAEKRESFGSLFFGVLGMMHSDMTCAPSDIGLQLGIESEPRSDLGVQVPCGS